MSLAEISLGEIVVAYLEHLESAGELDLDAATEFLVLIASLLELKSRLLLPSPEDDVAELGPEEAADELLARMLEYRRYRDAAAHLGELFAEGRRYVYRSAPLPAGAAARLPRRRHPGVRADSPLRGDRRPAADAARARHQPHPSTVSLERRLALLRELLGRRGRFDFDEAFAGEDRLTQAVTLFALLEMHKLGEATWTQKKLFGPIQVEVADRRGPRAVVE